MLCSDAAGVSRNEGWLHGFIVFVEEGGECLIESTLSFEKHEIIRVSRQRNRSVRPVPISVFNDAFTERYLENAGDKCSSCKNFIIPSDLLFIILEFRLIQS